MEKTAKNFAIWMALNSENFYSFSSRPSFYGGPECTTRQKQQMKLFSEKTKINTYLGCVGQDKFLTAISKIGIDWDKSSTPESDSQHRFVGTFYDAEIIDYVSGTLVLLDGQEIDYHSECVIDMNQFDNFKKFFALGD